MRPALCLIPLLALLMVSGAVAGETKLSVVEKLQLARDAKNAESEVRAATIAELGRVSSKENTDYGVAEKMVEIATKDADRVVRREAIKALGTLQNTVATTKTLYVKPLTEMLKNKDESPVIKKAIIALFKNTLDDALPDQAAVAVILDIAKNKTEPNTGLRGEALEALGLFAKPESLDVLADALAEQDQYLKERAAAAMFSVLQRLPDSGDKIKIPTIQRLNEMAADKALPLDMRLGVMRVLARLVQDNNTAAKQVMPLLIASAKNAEDLNLAKGAIEALGLTGSGDAVPPLVEAYKVFEEKDVAVRQTVARALQKIIQVQIRKPSIDAAAVSDAVSQLIHIVSHENSEEVLKTAVYAMQYLDPKKVDKKHIAPAVNALLDLLDMQVKEKKFAGIGDTTLNSLEFLTGMDFRHDMKRWDEWFKKNHPGFTVPKK